MLIIWFIGVIIIGIITMYQLTKVYGGTQENIAWALASVYPAWALILGVLLWPVCLITAIAIYLFTRVEKMMKEAKDA